MVSPGEVEALATLPSFLLLPTEHEVPPEGAVAALGRSARPSPSARWPASAAPSCRTGWSPRPSPGCATPASTGTRPILPWRGADVEHSEPDPDEDPAESQRVSPVEASSLYLEHLRAAWNHAHPDAPLEEQEVFLTVPASFDAVARELTMDAAQQAGLAQVTLLEEPQAAFYAWLSPGRRRLARAA